jgi:hypothetical protein
MTCNTTETGVVPVAGTWYSFKIWLQTLPTQTILQASVWREGNSEPADWQIDCYDETSGRLTEGTVGVWSMGDGAKYWDDLDVVPLVAPRPPPPAAPAVLPLP